MDPFSLAAIAAPFVAKGAEAFTKTAGDKLGAKVGELCQAAVDKFKGDSDAEETLALAQKKPESKGLQSALEEVLAEKLEADPDFAERVQRLVDEVQKGSTRTVFDQRGQTVHGPQTNIAGDVLGPVLSGQFSGPVATGGAAIDLRGSRGAVYRPSGPLNQHFWVNNNNLQNFEIDDIDKMILKAMAPGGTLMQGVEGLSKLLSINMKELKERLTILAGTTPYVKDEGHRHLGSTGPEMVSLTAYGLRFVRDNLSDE